MSFSKMNVELLQLIYENPWLTNDELRVLQLKYKQNMPNYQIAMEMNCSKETIGRMFKKIHHKVKPIIIEYFKNHPEYLDTPQQ